MSLRENNKQRVRERILEVSERLFRSRGFDETTVDEIARRARVSRQTFFNYFPQKEAALTELGMRWIQGQVRLPARGAELAQSGALPTLDDFKRAVGEQVRAIEEDRDFMRLVFTRSGLFFPQGPHVGQPGDKARLERTQGMFQAMAEIARVGAERGVLRSDVDPLQFAEIWVAVMVITIRLWLTDYWSDPGELEDRVLKAVDVLLYGMVPR